MANVLIVDDNEQNLYILETLLVNRGHHVIRAVNGRQALDHAHASPPDVIVTDILMPEMDGFALCRRWMADDRLRNRPFVFYTAAYTDSRDEELALKLGADRFICKPAKVEELAGALDEVLASSRAARKSEQSAEVDETAFLKQYNQVLVRKLEEKVDELQAANQELSASLEDLRDAQEGLRVRDRALAATPTGIAIIDATLKTNPIIDCNQAFIEITGYPREEIIGQQCGFLQSGLEPQAEFQELARAMEEQSSCRVVLQSRRKDGSAFWHRTTISPVHDHDRTTHFVCIHEDVTASHLAAIERREQERQLSLVSRFSALGEMVSGIAHEMNQPLYSIQNYSKACANLIGRDASGTSDFDKLEHWLDEITVCAEHAGTLLGRLREFVDRRSSERASVDLCEVIEAAVALASREGQRRGVSIERLPGVCPVVQADSVEIQQVLVNLLLNTFDAIQKAEPESPLVTIGVTATKDSVEIAVADNGCGLPADERLKIFAPFQSTNDDRMGLGLAIATTIVESHGGKLWAENRSQGGATFRFTLPVALEANSE